MLRFSDLSCNSTTSNELSAKSLYCVTWFRGSLASPANSSGIRAICSAVALNRRQGARRRITARASDDPVTKDPAI
jgi:hypothetical protein